MPHRWLATLAVFKGGARRLERLTAEREPAMPVGDRGSHTGECSSTLLRAVIHHLSQEPGYCSAPK